jgi:hypothetical protein
MFVPGAVTPLVVQALPILVPVVAPIAAVAEPINSIRNPVTDPRPISESGAIADSRSRARAEPNIRDAPTDVRAGRKPWR